MIFTTKILLHRELTELIFVEKSMNKLNRVTEFEKNSERTVSRMLTAYKKWSQIRENKKQ